MASQEKKGSSCRSYGEPWSARPGSLPPPMPDEEPLPESARPWLVWGHVCPEMAGEAEVLTSPGEIKTFTDEWPFLTFRRSHACNVEPEPLVKRIAECVNFCAGVRLDETGFASLKELLESLDDVASATRREVNKLWQPTTTPTKNSTRSRKKSTTKAGSATCAEDK